MEIFLVASTFFQEKMLFPKMALSGMWASKPRMFHFCTQRVKPSRPVYLTHVLVGIPELCWNSQQAPRWKNDRINIVPFKAQKKKYTSVFSLNTLHLSNTFYYTHAFVHRDRRMLR